MTLLLSIESFKTMVVFMSTTMVVFICVMVLFGCFVWLFIFNSLGIKPITPSQKQACRGKIG